MTHTHFLQHVRCCALAGPRTEACTAGGSVTGGHQESPGGLVLPSQAGGEAVTYGDAVISVQPFFFISQRRSVQDHSFHRVLYFRCPYPKVRIVTEPNSPVTLVRLLCHHLTGVQNLSSPSGRLLLMPLGRGLSMNSNSSRSPERFSPALSGSLGSSWVGRVVNPGTFPAIPGAVLSSRDWCFREKLAPSLA